MPSRAPKQDKFEDVRKHGDVLMTEFPDSGYAPLTALYLAKAALADKRPDEATAHLTWVKGNAPLPELQLVATTRLARLALDAAVRTPFSCIRRWGSAICSSGV